MRAVATIDDLAPGRFEFGVGVGWMREEFEVLGVDSTRIGELHGRLSILPQDALFQANVAVREQLEFMARLGGMTPAQAADLLQVEPEVLERLRNRRNIGYVRVAGLVGLGTSFGADGNLLTSSETFLGLLPNTPPGSIEVGLIRLTPGSDLAQVQERLKDLLPEDVRVLTKAGFIAFEQDYWRTSTSIGFIFSLGAAMGFVVGCVIVYQVLYSDVSDHLPEYATLMAMGYRLTSLLGVVAREGLLLAAFGYLPAYAAGPGRPSHPVRPAARRRLKPTAGL